MFDTRSDEVTKPNVGLLQLFTKSVVVDIIEQNTFFYSLRSHSNHLLPFTTFNGGRNNVKEEATGTLTYYKISHFAKQYIQFFSQSFDLGQTLSTLVDASLLLTSASLCIVFGPLGSSKSAVRDIGVNMCVRSTSRSLSILLVGCRNGSIHWFRRQGYCFEIGLIHIFGKDLWFCFSSSVS